MLMKEYGPVMREIADRFSPPSTGSGAGSATARNEGYEVIVIDEKNWREYIDLPDYIIRRRERKQIPPAHFTDLLRLELLIRYGGTWIDSTVLCTGFKFFDKRSGKAERQDSGEHELPRI